MEMHRDKPDLMIEKIVDYVSARGVNIFDNKLDYRKHHQAFHDNIRDKLIEINYCYYDNNILFSI